MPKKTLLIVVAIVIVLLLVAGYFFIIKKPATPIVWDGNYKMEGVLNCTGNFPNLTSIPMSSILTVSNNKIVEQFQGQTLSFDIDKHGKATEIIPSTTNQGATASGKADYQFSNKGGVYGFTAVGRMDISATQNGTTYSSTCTGDITGVKQ